MEIIDGVEINELSLYIKRNKTLIIADLHLGYEESLNVRGVLVPRIQFKDTYEKLDKLLKNLDVETIIITGDFKHEFGFISNTEWNNILKIIDLFFKYAKKIILIKGNHDVNLGPIAKKINIEILGYVKFDDIFICHGDEILKEFNKSKIIIIGHEHPAIGLIKGNKYEKYKCFLKGKFEDKVLIVLPSFNVLTIGTDILREKLLSPFLQNDLSNFEVYIYENEKVFNFGSLRKLHGR